MVVALGSSQETNLKIWFCESCDCYHIKINEMLLTLDSHEFASLFNEIIDCYYSSFSARNLIDESHFS
jgi:hypothetical protein